jgi:hypothetical protein
MLAILFIGASLPRCAQEKPLRLCCHELPEDRQVRHMMPDSIADINQRRQIGTEHVRDESRCCDKGMRLAIAGTQKASDQALPAECRLVPMVSTHTCQPDSTPARPPSQHTPLNDVRAARVGSCYRHSRTPPPTSRHRCSDAWLPSRWLADSYCDSWSQHWGVVASQLPVLLVVCGFARPHPHGSWACRLVRLCRTALPRQLQQHCAAVSMAIVALTVGGRGAPIPCQTERIRSPMPSPRPGHGHPSRTRWKRSCSISYSPSTWLFRAYRCVVAP